MKKKVLFALIALFSFVGAWAEGETVVNKDGAIGYVVLPSTGGIAAENLAVQVGTTITPGTAIFAADATTSVTSIDAVGNYFLKVDDSGKLYPFQVAQKLTDYELIDTEEKYNDSKASGVLQLYYNWADGKVDGQNGSKPYKEDLWNALTHKGAGWNEWVKGTDDEPILDENGFIQYEDAEGNECERNWYGALANPLEASWTNAGHLSGWPWVGVNFSSDTSGNAYKVAFAYEGVEDLVYPWGENVFGNGTGLKSWGTAGLARKFNTPGWSIGLGAFEGEVYQGDNNESYLANFEENNFSVLLFPAEAPNADILFDYSWSMTPTVVAYNAQAQAPIITVTAKNINGEEVEVPQTSATDNNTANWTVKYFDDAACAEANEVTSMVDKGTYYVQVYVDGEAIGEAQTFTITAFQLTLGASVSYKQIGDPDPDPTYSLLYDNAPEAVKAEAANLKITGLKLTRSYPETNPIAEDKVGDQIACFIEMIDAKVVEIVEGEEVANENYQIGTSSVNTWLKVTQKLIDENFTIELEQNDFTYDKSEKKPAIVVKYKGTDVTNQFDLDATVYANNINANAYGKADNTGTEAAPVWVNNWIPEKPHATATATPKADGKYAYQITTVEDNKTVTLYTDLDENTAGNQLLTAEFKIKQRQITAADLSNVDAKIFKNAAWEPEVTVSFENTALTPSTVTLSPVAVESTPADYTLTFTNNKWVGTARYTVEATISEGKYTGNYWDKAYKEFAINKYQFTLQPTPGQGKLYGTTAAENLTAEGVPAENMPELANIALNAEGKLVGDNLAQIVAAGYTVTRSPADINEVGIYAVTISGAELIATEDPAAESDPAHNFDMTVVGGEFEIFNEDEYFVSSKFATREFESNNVTVPFNGFYVYRKTQTPVGYSNPPRTRDLYVLIPEADAAELYEEIGQRVKENELAEEQDPSVIQLQVTDYRINPVINNDIVTSYTLSVLPETVTYIDGSNVNSVTRDVFTQEGEGTLRVTPRTIKIVAEDKNTTFGAEGHPAQLTWKVYGKAEDGTVTKELTGFSLIAGSAAEANQPNTIGNWEGLTSDALTFVPDANTEWSADKTITKPIVMAGTLQALNSANPNYSITFEEGTYTITKSDKKIDIAVTWTQAFGSDDEPIATLTAKMGTDEYVSENLPDPEDLSYTEQAGKPVGQSVGDVPVTVTGGPEFIDGYPVEYTGTFVTTSGEALTIIVNNQFPVYPTAPKSDFASPYVKITGPTTIAALAEEGLALQFNKPAVGYIADGGDIQVVCGEGDDAVAFGSATGYTLTEADKTGAWAWAKNYASVTIKSGKARPSASEDITLDIVSFQKAKYDAEADVTDQLIRDYHGKKVNSVTIKCSKQGTEVAKADQYEIVGDQWYSMVLPFDATTREIQQIFNGFVYIDRLKTDGKDNTTKASEIVFTLKAENVPANEPFVAKTDQNFVFAPVTISRGDKKIEIKYPVDEEKNPTIASITDARGNQFIGTYSAFFADNTSDYDFINLSHGLIQAMNKDAYVRPLGAYFKVATGVDNAHAPLRIVFEEADGTTTVIEGVEAEGAAEVAYGEGWYTINGIQLEGEPTTSGTYIFNGKKVFIQK